MLSLYLIIYNLTIIRQQPPGTPSSPVPVSDHVAQTTVTAETTLTAEQLRCEVPPAKSVVQIILYCRQEFITSILHQSHSSDDEFETDRLDYINCCSPEMTLHNLVSGLDMKNQAQMTMTVLLPSSPDPVVRSSPTPTSGSPLSRSPSNSADPVNASRSSSVHASPARRSSPVLQQTRR